ncbi:hypothetical protein EB008_01025 [bacterium]|nr:hypothetical protein [bacterium]
MLKVERFAMTGNDPISLVRNRTHSSHPTQHALEKLDFLDELPLIERVFLFIKEFFSTRKHTRSFSDIKYKIQQRAFGRLNDDQKSLCFKELTRHQKQIGRYSQFLSYLGTQHPETFSYIRNHLESRKN